MAEYLSRAPHDLRSAGHPELRGPWRPGQVLELSDEAASEARAVWGAWIVPLSAPGQGEPVSSPVDRAIKAAPKTRARKRGRKKRSK